MIRPTPDFIADRAFSQPPIYLTDLDRCTPSSALTPESRRHTWRTLPYSTDAFSGVMLLAGPETAAPSVTYPLNADGWHAVSIGVHPFWSEPEGRQLEVQLKLTDQVRSPSFPGHASHSAATRNTSMSTSGAWRISRAGTW